MATPDVCQQQKRVISSAVEVLALDVKYATKYLLVDWRHLLESCARPPVGFMGGFFDLGSLLRIFKLGVAADYTY